jgi:hypothetical protein
MSQRDDDSIDFDFFDEEPATEQSTQRRTALRPRPRTSQGPRPPRRRPPGGAQQQFTPLLRLILAVALAIFFVVVLVFWIQGCRSDSRRESYANYMESMATLANSSEAISSDLQKQLTTPGIKQADLIEALEGLTDRQEQVVRNAENIDPPGPLREAHRGAVEALQFRVSGLNGLVSAFRQTSNDRDATRAGTLLAEQAERLVASDVIWEDLFLVPVQQELRRQDIRGVNVPDSNALPDDSDLASQRSMIALAQRLQGAAAGGTPTGLHGTGIVSTVVLPSGDQLSTSSENVVEATQDLAFRVTIQNTGEHQEVGIKITLTIQKTPEPIVKTATIDLINPNEQKSVTFEDLGQPPFGPTTPVKVDVSPVPGESRTTNNSSEYPVVFSLP